MGTQLDAYNLALSHLDLSQRVQSLTEDSANAGYCNAFYDRARKLVLEQCYFSFSTKAAALSLLLDQGLLASTSAQVFPGWRYVYQRPQDCLKAQVVTTQYGIRQFPYMGYWWGIANGLYGAQSFGPIRPPWCEMLDQIQSPTGQSIDILTDQVQAWLVYTTDISINVASETFLDCVAWQLATLIAGPVSASAAAKKMAQSMAPLSLTRALAQNLNEQQTDPYPQSPSIQARL